MPNPKLGTGQKETHIYGWRCGCLSTAPEGQEWVLRNVGQCRYKFILTGQWILTPNPRSCARLPSACGAIHAGGVIALFEFEDEDDGVRVRDERHYRLVPQEQLTAEELGRHRQNSDLGMA